ARAGRRQLPRSPFAKYRRPSPVRPRQRLPARLAAPSARTRRAAKGRAGSGGDAGVYAESWVCEDSGKGLQVGERDAIANGSVLIIVVGLHKGVLRVDHLEHRGFASLVAQRGETLAFGGKVGRALQAGELVERSFRFRIQRANLGDELALRVG